MISSDTKYLLYTVGFWVGLAGALIGALDNNLLFSVSCIIVSLYCHTHRYIEDIKLAFVMLMQENKIEKEITADKLTKEELEKNRKILMKAEGKLFKVKIHEDMDTVFAYDQIKKEAYLNKIFIVKAFEEHEQYFVYPEFNFFFLKNELEILEEIVDMNDSTDK